MWKEIKATLHLGWPIILGNITQISLGIIDSAMVGAIHSSQLAAASFINNVIAIPQVLCIGMTMAISPLVSTAMGGTDQNLPMRILYNGLWAVGITAFVLALSLYLGVDIVYHLGQDPIVAELARGYLIWMGWAMLPMGLFMALKQFCDGLGKTRWPMYLSLLALPANVLLNYLLIYGKWGAPRLELVGAGIGTLLSRVLILGGIVLLILRGRDFAPYRQQLGQQLRFDRERLRDVIRIGIPSSLQYGMESAAFAVSGIMVGWLGYQQQAAHQIALSMAALTFMVSLGISAAGSIRVAFAYGQHDWSRVRAIGKSTMAMSAIYGLLCGLVFIGGRHYFPRLFNEEIEVLKYAGFLLFFAAAFQISDSVQAINVGLLRGIQDVRRPTLLVAVAYWVIGIPVGYLLAFTAGWQIAGIWIGLIVGLSFSALLLGLRFLRLSKRRVMG